MNKSLKYLQAVTLITVLLFCVVGVKAQAPQIEVDSFARSVADTNGIYIVDVRTPGEYKAGHIEGAINASFIGFKFKKKMKQLDRSRPVYIYCQTAHRSPYASLTLYKLGFTEVYDLKKGFAVWKKAGKPIVIEEQ